MLNLDRFENLFKHHFNDSHTFIPVLKNILMNFSRNKMRCKLCRSLEASNCGENKLKEIKRNVHE